MGRKKSKPVNGDGAEGNAGTNGPNTSGGPGGETMQGYFRQLFREHPEWVKPRSNERIYQRWHQDHPGHTEVPKQWQNALTNVKSHLRRKGKGKGKGRRVGRPPAAVTPRARSAGPKPPARTLLELEEKIDDCLLVARTAGGDALEHIADQLRRVRNAVIKMSE